MEKVYKDPSETVKSVVMRAKGIASDTNRPVTIIMENGLETSMYPDSNTADTYSIILLKEAVETYKLLSNNR